jgi:general secretion pathway protein L
MPEGTGEWQWSDGDHWNKESSLETLIQATSKYHGEEISVFFPSRDIQIIEQAFTKAQYKQLGGEGVKYLLEEYVIQPIDSLKILHHFVNPDRLYVLGVSISTIETIQNSFSLLPFKVVSLLPDFLVLPIPAENECVIAEINGRLLVRENEWVGNSLDDLAVYLDYQDAEKKYKISNLSNIQIESLEAITSHENISSFHYEFEKLLKPKAHFWNVLPKVKSSMNISGYWKPCAILLVFALIFQFSYDLVRWYQYKKVADQTAVQAVDLYKYWFGQSFRVNEQNLKSSFKSQLNLSQTGDTQALQILSRVGPVLMQNQITASKVSYENSILNLELKANSSQVLQNLAQQLNQQGFKAELGSVQADAIGAVGTVKIQ